MSTNNILSPSPEAPLQVSQFIRCSRFEGRRDNSPKNLNATWEELIAENVLGKAYPVQGATKEEAKAQLQAFSAAAYPPGGTRGGRDLDSLQIFVLDFDNMSLQPTGENKDNGEPIFAKLPIPGAPRLDDVSHHVTDLGVTHFGHHSYSSSPQLERFRILIPVDQPSEGKNWKIVSEWLLAQLKMDHWRSMGCIDLGAMHNPAAIYYTPGYWDKEPDAKDRIKFVSSTGISLNLPTEEELAAFSAPEVPIHPLRKEWLEKHAATHTATTSGIPGQWFKPYKVDFKTLDIVAMLQEMGSSVQAPTVHGDGLKARCSCPLATEHTGGKDDGDAVVFFGPGKWPGFMCPHDVHAGLKLEGICLAAGVEMVRRHAQPFEARSMEQELEEVFNGKSRSKKGSEKADKAAEERKSRLSDVLMDQGIDPEEITFNKLGGIGRSRPNLEKILCQGSDYLDGVRWNELFLAAEIKVPGCTYLKPEDADKALTALQIHLEDRWETPWSEDSVFKVTNLVSSRYSYHPVKVYFEKLPAWDGVDRFPMVRDEVLGTNQTPDHEKYSALYAEYLKCTLIGAVRRVLEPGCKMDTVAILHGPQAARKSTFWRTLRADPLWFNDSKIHIETVEGQKILQSAWIHELSEIDDMTSVKSAEAVKAFVSSAKDNFRKSYGKVPEVHYRRCIMVGSTNKEEVLNDPTGSRRFWVIPTAAKINIELLKENLDQIWAQAYKLYQDGEPHHLSEEMDALRVPQSDRHQMENRYDDLVPNIIQFYRSYATSKGVTLNAIFGFLKGKMDGSTGFAEPTAADRRTLSACLRAKGWTVKQCTVYGVPGKYFMAPDRCLQDTPERQVGLEFPAPDLTGDIFSSKPQGPLL